MDFAVLAKVILYWSSFLVLPLTVIEVYRLCSKKFINRRWSHSVFLVLCLFFCWSRFIEPQIIRVQYTKINAGWQQSLTAVLIADTHLGIYKGRGFFSRVVDKINQIDADIVLFAGDFVHYSNDLPRDFSPLRKINKPTYVVFGNHDAGYPGPDVRSELREIFRRNDIELLDNREVDLFLGSEGEDKNIKLLGLGSNYADNDKTELLSQFTSDKDVLVLLHNPDSILTYPAPNVADVTVAGHTHCGQIRLPWLYKSVLPTQGNFDKGLSQETNTQLFITCGLGEVGLPLRLFNPPVIDVLEIR